MVFDGGEVEDIITLFNLGANNAHYIGLSNKLSFNESRYIIIEELCADVGFGGGAEDILTLGFLFLTAVFGRGSSVLL